LKMPEGATAVGAEEAAGFNENQAAFFDFLAKNYNKDGALQDLLKEMEDGKDEAGHIPESAQRIFEEAAKRKGDESAPVTASGKGIMCIKSWDVAGKKIFLNLASSDKIDAPELVMKDGEEQTRLPMSMAAPMEDVDAKGEACLVVDVMFNPATLEDAGNFQFLSFIVQMCMVRFEEKYPELPKFNGERKFKKLKQKQFKGRQIGTQVLQPQPLMRGVDEESGLRDFSGPALAEPSFQVSEPKRKADGAHVLRLRVELPEVDGEEIQFQILNEQCKLLVPGKFRADIPIEVNAGYSLLSARFHRENHTFTVVWGPQHAKQFDEDRHAAMLEEEAKEKERQRIKLENSVAFSIVTCDDY